MLFFRKLISVGMLLCICVGSSAMDTEKITMPTTWYEKVWSDFKEPFVTDANYIMLGGLLGTGALLATRNDTIDPLQESWSTRKPLGGSADFFRLMGEWVPNVLYMAGMSGYAWVTDQKVFHGYSGLMLRSTVFSGLTTIALKVTVQQERPNSSNNRSFPSGHTTTAFSFASVVAHQHGWKYGIPAYLAAAGAGVSRINDNKHFLHDVVMGAAIGAAYGISLSRKYNQQTTLNKDESVVSSTVWMPMVSQQANGVMFFFRF